MLVSCSLDNKIKFWDLESYKEMHTLRIPGLLK